MDIHISGINGVTLVKLLRKQYFNKKIIGTSSDINIKYLDPKINELFDSIIIKPFDENIILDKLKY
jgi:response regulator of citrate/malate metabolism